MKTKSSDMLYKSAAIIACLFSLGCQAEVIIASAPEKKRDGKAPPHSLKVKLQLSIGEVSPGEQVRLTETVPESMQGSVIAITHKVILIGRYDERTSGLANLELEEFRPMSPSRVFDCLSEAETFPHSMRFDVKTPREKGIELEFSPKRLGIFIIRAEWHLKDGGEILESNPAILVVNIPKAKEKGGVAKPEWLIDR